MAGFHLPGRGTVCPPGDILKNCWSSGNVVFAIRPPFIKKHFCHQQQQYRQNSGSDDVGLFALVNLCIGELM
jgi:hypothetical protein